MTIHIGKTITYFLIGFLIFFLLRLGYGYWSQPNGVVIQSHRGFAQINSDFSLSRKNYAGQKGGGGGLGPASVDQRYERVATLGTVTHEFDADEALVRDTAAKAKALIQHEQAFGLTGQRQLQLALGVNPALFDQVIDDLRTIGSPVSFQVNKTDKTNEYRELLAKQVSLRKSRDNLVGLKSRDAELGDLVALETRILDLENQIQALGVSVGEFDSEFEFVTIKLTLSEVPAPRLRNIALVRRAFVAFVWAVKFYAGVCIAFLAFAGAMTLMARLRKE